MRTKPGERRPLYADGALSKGLTINAAISPMGLAWMEYGYSSLFDFLVGRPMKRDVTPEESLLFFAGGRMYLNFSNMIWLANPRALSKGSATNDALMGEIVASVDAKRYRATTRPSWARLRMLRFIPGLFWRMRGLFWNMLWAILSPERAHRAYQQTVDANELKFTENISYDLPLDEFQRTYLAAVAQTFGVSMSVLMAAFVALVSVDLVVLTMSAEEKGLAEKLKRGFTGNVVVEMGITLFRLARLLDRSDFEDLTRLAERVENRQMSAEFLSAWDAFILTYGCRGPMEMDLASPRYGDVPSLALRQMSFMTGDDEGSDPEAAHRRHVEERRRAYEALIVWYTVSQFRRSRVLRFLGTETIHHNPEQSLRSVVLVGMVQEVVDSWLQQHEPVGYEFVH